MLAGACVRGQTGVAREVRFQRLYEGEPLDDLIILSDLPSGSRKLALQIKRDLTFGAADATFDEVMRACWDTYRSPNFTRGMDRFGIVLGLYSRRIDEHFQRVLSWASSSTSPADFARRIGQPGLSSAEQRGFHDLIRLKLESFGDQVEEETLWDFLKHMVLLHFDLESEGSSARALAIEQLSRVLPPDRLAESAVLFDVLVVQAASASSAAGSLDAAMLRKTLVEKGLTLLTPIQIGADLARISEEANVVLKGIRGDIGGLVLNREEQVIAAEEAARRGGLVAIVGPPGVGKSSILGALVRRQLEEGPVLLLSGERLNGVTGLGWKAVAKELDLSTGLSDLLSALHSNAVQCVFIDGIDRVTSSSARAAVNELLAVLGDRADNNIRWPAVVTAREASLPELVDWLDWRMLQTLRSVRVSALSVEEIGVVAAHSPRLRPLLLQHHLLPILGNAFFLRILDDPRVLPEQQVAPLASEVQVRDTWWERLVGAGGQAGRMRQQALLSLGRQAASSPGNPVLGADISGSVLVSLEVDGILVRVPGRDVYRFGHDVLEDWVLSRALDVNTSDLPAELVRLGQPLGALRALQISVAAVLERSHAADAWIRLLRQFANVADLAPRWRQAVLIAPLLTSHPEEILDSAGQELLAKGGALLGELLKAARTAEVFPNYAYLPGATAVARDTGELLALLLQEPVPSLRVWQPLLAWLVPRLASLPEEVQYEAAQAMFIWQRSTLPTSPYRKAIGEQAEAWLHQAEAWRFRNRTPRSIVPELD